MLGKERCFGRHISFGEILTKPPHAIARIEGSSKYQEILGIMSFYQTDCGVLVATEVTGLPYMPGSCEHFVFALHIHEGSNCSGNNDDEFANAGTHYDPANCMHPRHAGDLPPLFENEGYAFSVFLTDRFIINEIFEKTVIIHAKPDDFITQPAGNAGEKIACGIIRKFII